MVCVCSAGSDRTCWMGRTPPREDWTTSRWCGDEDAGYDRHQARKHRGMALRCVHLTLSESGRTDILTWPALFFSKPLNQFLSHATSHHALMSLVLALECRRNIRFQTGYNAQIRPIRPTLDKIAPAHRPLLFYLLIASFNTLVDVTLNLVGFQSYDSNCKEQLGYHYHPGLHGPGAGLLSFVLTCFLPHRRSVKREQPTIILHGLGGYAPLVHFIIALLFLERPVFIVHQPHVSFKLAFGSPSAIIPSMPEMVSSIHSMLLQHGFRSTEEGPRAIVVAHSLGTGLAAALSTHSPHSDTFQTVLIDPISIRLYDPHLARTFSVCRPRTAFAQIIRYFSLEIGVNLYVSRHFSAFDNCLLLQADDEGKIKSEVQTSVVLARNDFLVPGNAIERHCLDTGIACEVLENTDHGGFLMSVPVFWQVFKVVRGVSENMRKPNQSLSIVEHKSSALAAANSNSTTILSNTPMNRIASRIASNGTLMAIRPSNSLSRNSACAGGVSRAARGRSRTLCGAPMMAWKPSRSGWSAGVMGGLERADRVMDVVVGGKLG